METSFFSITTNQPEAEKSLLFVTCVKGLESYLVQELESLGIPNVKAAIAGVLIPSATLEQGMSICYGSRLALRVLWQIHAFRLWKPQNLYQQVSKISWKPWLVNSSNEELRSFKIAISGHSRHFANTHFAVQRTKDAICDHLRESIGARPSVDKQDADVRLQLHLEEERASLYFDLSGAPLNQRGYRKEVGSAPLNEVVAASLLTLAGYDGYRPFCDPCCGSGTLLIEAGMIKTKTPPGFLRAQFGFENHPLFNVKQWQDVKKRFQAQITPLPSDWLVGIDKSPEAIGQARLHAAAFGWNDIHWLATPFQKVKLEKNYFVLTNPPFGRRLQEKSLQMLYRDLGIFFKNYASRAFAFSSDRELLQEIDLPVLQSFCVDFSGSTCWLERFKVIGAKSTKPTE